MPVVTVRDAGGQAMMLLQRNGRYYFNAPSHVSFATVLSLPVREDDVFVCSYPKSGTHWLLEIVWMLNTGRLSNDNVHLDDCFVESTLEDKLRSLPSPRVLATHLHLTRLPPDIVEKGCKVIYIIRNPKDVAVSFYNYLLSHNPTNYSGEWKDYMEPFALGKFANGSWFDHVFNWEAEKKKYSTISFVYYEDIKEDPPREIQRLDKLLGTNRSKEFLSRVCDLVSFHTMSQRKMAGPPQDSYYPIYRKGQVGDWKNWFTVAQNEWFDQLYSERMEGHDLNIRFNL